MGLREFFLWQLEHEAATSRKVIERVPEGQNSWKPHERSMELGYLAALVASMPGWVEFMVNRRELDLSDPANDVMRTKAGEDACRVVPHVSRGAGEVAPGAGGHDGRSSAGHVAFSHERQGNQRGSALRHDRRRSDHASGAPPRPTDRLSASDG